MYDPERYRAKEEVEAWKERDPLVTYPALLGRAGLVTDEVVGELEGEVAAEIDEAVAFAETSAIEPVEDLTRFVYSERTAS
jgi:TPP-dependent pyruvate/acetoin dehydrogenase alpha subunit